MLFNCASRVTENEAKTAAEIRALFKPKARKRKASAAKVHRKKRKVARQGKVPFPKSWLHGATVCEKCRRTHRCTLCTFILDSAHEPVMLTSMMFLLSHTCAQ